MNEVQRNECPKQRVVSVLFARVDSNYKKLGMDVWDAERDAMKWPGGSSAIYHPPCRYWGRMRDFATKNATSEEVEAERNLARWAVDQVREWGGVIEHPAYSTLWADKNLPAPGERDKYGGWTLPINQHSFGHRAEKKTWLYIVGCEPKEIPDLPIVLGKATHCIRPTKSYPRLPSVTKADREHTPPALAEWLIELARRCAR